MPLLTLREAVTLFLNVDPQIHDEKKACLRYRTFYEKFETAEKKVVRQWELEHPRSASNTGRGQAEPLHSIKITPDNFLNFIQRFAWTAGEELQKCAKNAIQIRNCGAAMSGALVRDGCTSGRNKPSDSKFHNLEITFGGLLLLFGVVTKQRSTISSKYLHGEKLNRSAVADAIASMIKDIGLADERERANGTEGIRKAVQAALQHFDPDKVKQLFSLRDTPPANTN